VPQPTRLLFIAGPPGCRLIQDKKQTLSVLRKKFTHCYEPNTAYGPYDLQIKAVKTKSIEKCQALCRWTPTCSHFTFWTLDGSCHLANTMDGEKRITGVADFVAGPPSCDNRMPSTLVHMRKRFLEPPSGQRTSDAATSRMSAAQAALLAVSGLAVLSGLAFAALGAMRSRPWSARSSSRPLEESFTRLPVSPMSRQRLGNSWHMFSE